MSDLSFSGDVALEVRRLLREAERLDSQSVVTAGIGHAKLTRLVDGGYLDDPRVQNLADTTRAAVESVIARLSAIERG